MINKKGNYKSVAKTSAVYRGGEVSTFKQDLSNYSELRRGLSKEMRAQTMTKTELKSVDPAIVQQYIDALNAWRASPQLLKAQRSGKGRNPVEAVFTEAARTKFVTSDEKAKLLAANLKIKSLSKEDARMKVTEGLNQKDRLRNEDFYKAKYYLDNGNFDPEQATDDMLRAVISSGYIDQYPEQQEQVMEEYIQRIYGVLGPDDAELIIASEKTNYYTDVLSLVTAIVGP